MSAMKKTGKLLRPFSTLLLILQFLFTPGCKKDTPQYTLTTDVLPSGSGTIILSPDGGIYPEGTEVTLTPTPGLSYKFVKWSGVNATSISGNKIVMSKNMKVNADFTAQYSLTVNVNPAGSGTVTLSPAGGIYDDGTVVTLTPNAGLSYSFVSWGGGDGSYVADNKIVMTRSREITANFATGFTGTTTNGVWFGDYPDLGYTDQIAFNIYNNTITTTNSSLVVPSTGDALSMVFIVYEIGHYTTHFCYNDIPIVNTGEFNYSFPSGAFTVTVSGTFTSSTSCTGKITKDDGSNLYSHDFVANFNHSKSSVYLLPVPFAKSGNF